MRWLSVRMLAVVAVGMLSAIFSGCDSAKDAPASGPIAISGKQKVNEETKPSDLPDAIEVASVNKENEPATDAVARSDSTPTDANAASSGDSSSGGESRRPPRQDSRPKEEIVEAKLPDDLDLLDPAVMPVWAMSKQQADTCLIKPGDTFPAFSLPDATDAKAKPKKLADVAGKALTVIMVWDLKHPYALDELSDLSGQVGQRFASQGLTLVGINTGDSADAAKEIAGKAAAHLSILTDPKNELRNKLAKDDKLPRTYLLDARGKVLWMDIEYSRFTRRQLKQAIRATLEPKKPAE